MDVVFLTRMYSLVDFMNISERLRFTIFCHFFDTIDFYSISDNQLEILPHFQNICSLIRDSKIY